MDFVDGLDAARLLASRYPAGMPIDHVVRIVTAMASALDYAHKQGLLHRDVKPANIMLTHFDDDEEQRILLADFGIARNLGDISGLTATNMTVGTVAYSAPEQLMGEEIDGRADQYSLAASAYQLLTGVQLFPHSNPAVVIGRHLNAIPPLLADTCPDLAPLDDVLSTALAKNPTDRFERCGDFARALAEQTHSVPTSQSAQTRPVPSPSSPVGFQSKSSPVQRGSAQQTGRARSMRAWMISVGVVTAVLLVAGIGGLWRPWEHQRSQRGGTSINSPSAASAASPTPPPPAARVFPASVIDTVLLTPAEINALVGSSDPLLQIKQTTYGMRNNANLVSPSSCVGVIFTGEHAVFENTGFTAMHDETLERTGGFTTNRGPIHVEQTIVVFPTPKQAQAVLSSSQSQWQACAKGQVRLGTVGQNGETA